MSENLENQPEQNAEPPSPPPTQGALVPDPSKESGFQRLIKKLDPTICKTVLDMDAVRRVLNKPRDTVEVKLKEAEARPAAPAKPKIAVESFRLATPCSSRWESMEGTERFRICNKCKLHVYDFDYLEVPEIQETVLKREGKMYTALFQRKDGKFLTSDCPVGVKEKRSNMMTIIIGLIVLVALSAAAVLAPRPAKAPYNPAENAVPEQALTQEDEWPTVDTGVKTESKSVSGKSTSGTSTTSTSENAGTKTDGSTKSTEPAKPEQPRFYKVPARAPRPKREVRNERRR